jgi:hypothetical protein
MPKKRGKIIQFVKFREPHKAEDGVRTSEEMDANPRSKTHIQMPRKRRQSLHHWTVKGWVAPSPFLTEIMRSPVIAPPTLRGTAVLEVRGSGLPPAEERRGPDPADQQEKVEEMGHPQGQSQRISELRRDRSEGSLRRGRCHGPDLAEFHWHVSSKKKELPPQKILKCGCIYLKWTKPSQIGPRRKNGRLDGRHTKPPPGLCANRYSPIFAAA